MALATFAGGCFWCLVKPFDSYEGVESVISGYSGGHVENPTYEAVCSDTTGHVEAVQIEYDPNQISYTQMLDIYFKTFDPTDNNGQFFDRGDHYRPVIFYHNDEQKALALAKIQALNAAKIFDKPVNTPVEPYKNFYPAEAYHQNYYQKNPLHYAQYQLGSGRKAFIDRHWSDHND
ncbi:peptide-methionine (S)-S-oxide reductase MsrA [Staphylococcus hyicus]|uniref:peptide-methionine (S)-S-oxide reductase MsrA n=1 Tax=Staphylococcus hyicus TaxID=1284 RepID=UPI00208EFF89|nr:peptide-methionine (S)-S-oxide reductase MsrA [Staphylococcus hyicus]MCO4329487.1 peptide-methionine (S)-S-oxide reductase MsrA [Staphylococcus hyicus]MCO4336107.1 peptide-methionine (S)-S-oxide reductase MsrA [Staphylococcus hyicus]UWF55784.1 peptide-methionine (S)-S-oxide reductase MsrA [Staphylococcus hyicus]